MTNNYSGMDPEEVIPAILADWLNGVFPDIKPKTVGVNDTLPTDDDQIEEVVVKPPNSLILGNYEVSD